MLQAAGMVGMRFNTIGVSDGISMGTDGMSFSLQSRDLIADSIETVMGGQWYDAYHHPRLRQEYAGLHDRHGPAEPARAHGLRRHHPRRPQPTARSSISSRRSRATANFCRATSTNTSASASCATRAPARAPAAACTPPTPWRPPSKRMGMSLPYSSSTPAEDPQKLEECVRAGAAIRNLLELDLKPRDIMTRAAFENAMVVVTRAGRVHQRGAASDRDGALGGRAADPRRFPGGQRPHAAAGRFQTQRQICDGRSARGRRHCPP